MSNDCLITMSSTYFKLTGFVLFIVIAAVACSGKKKRHKITFSSSASHVMMQTYSLKPAESDYIAHLSGKNEISASPSSNATGQVLFNVSDDNSQIYYTINLHRIDSLTVVQIRYGVPGKRGKFVARLYPRLNVGNALRRGVVVNGTLISAMLNEEDLAGQFKREKMSDLIKAISHDSIFIQVDTKTYPQGEIRGSLKKADF